MKTNSELRALSVDELEEKVLDLRKEQFDLRLKKANGALDKSHQIRLVRKAIARVKTIMTEKVGKSHDK